MQTAETGIISMHLSVRQVTYHFTRFLRFYDARRQNAGCGMRSEEYRKGQLRVDPTFAAACLGNPFRTGGFNGVKNPAVTAKSGI